MLEEKKNNILNYLVILVKWKKFLLAILLPTLIISYLAIYFLIDEQFDSSALIVPAEDTSLEGITNLIGDFGENLPFGIGSSTSPEMNIYNTIIYSRTNLEKVIEKFDLVDIYGLDTEKADYMEKALKILAGNIEAEETEYNAYELKVRAPSPELSADITNYIIQLLNKKLIELKTEKSKNSRIFLGDRIADIRTNLKYSEDSLMVYQEKSGILEPEEQFKGLVEAYSSLETELITKQIEKSILEKIRVKDSPQLENITLQVNEFENRLKRLKKHGAPDGMMPALDKLPEKAINYFRLLREVEINSKILEFVLPLYEQAKIEEKKDIPTLQVIDYAVPPAKKSFPPRTILSIIITFSVFLITFIFILMKENPNLQSSDKMKYIKENLFKWHKRS